MGQEIKIVDVTPRDGLQNESKPVETAQKLQLIKKLVDAGVRNIQAASFVHPRWVPQMADAEAVCAGLHQFEGITFSALVPNVLGYERATAAGILHHEFVISASNTFNTKNLNKTINESLALLTEVSSKAHADGVRIRVGISTSFHCPFQGPIATRALVDLVRAVRERCEWQVALCDTDGMAFPNQISQAIEILKDEMKLDPIEDLSLHFHDTYGRGLANTLAGLNAGIREFDATVAGLGGCPYCPGASGNLATEDLVAMLHGLGYDTGIDFEKLLDAAEFAQQFSSRPYSGHLLRSRSGTACGV
jgi:hydroxymethylglutaryl-CoA lyase